MPRTGAAEAGAPRLLFRDILTGTSFLGFAACLLSTPPRDTKSLAHISSGRKTMSVCTVALIVYYLGYMPPRGTVITVPQSRVAVLTPFQKAKADRCAKRYGIVWKVDEGN